MTTITRTHSLRSLAERAARGRSARPYPDFAERAGMSSFDAATEARPADVPARFDPDRRVPLRPAQATNKDGR